MNFPKFIMALSGTGAGILDVHGDDDAHGVDDARSGAISHQFFGKDVEDEDGTTTSGFTSRSSTSTL
jgi:hypothetical protein